jgi:hypothetical protein
MKKQHFFKLGLCICILGVGVVTGYAWQCPICERQLNFSQPRYCIGIEVSRVLVCGSCYNTHGQQQDDAMGDQMSLDDCLSLYVATLKSLEDIIHAVACLQHQSDLRMMGFRFSAFNADELQYYLNENHGFAKVFYNKRQEKINKLEARFANKPINGFESQYFAKFCTPEHFIQFAQILDQIVQDLALEIPKGKEKQYYSLKALHDDSDLQQMAVRSDLYLTRKNSADWWLTRIPPITETEE